MATGVLGPRIPAAVKRAQGEYRNEPVTATTLQLNTMDWIVNSLTGVVSSGRLKVIVEFVTTSPVQVRDLFTLFYLFFHIIKNTDREFKGKIDRYIYIYI